MHQFLTDIKTVVVDTLFPIRCVACGTENPRFVCEQCLLEFSDAASQRCMECGRPALHGITHSGCRRPYAADRLASVWNYKNPKVAAAITSGKYKFLPIVYNELADYAAELIRQTAPIDILENFIICPLPLTKRRWRWRGFNQAEIICECMAQHFGLPIERLLRRTKSRGPQKDLNKEQRLNNVAGCFALAPQAEARGKNILLVDDVTTTGATLKEAAQVLKRSGAAQVWCLTLAQD